VDEILLEWHVVTPFEMNDEKNAEIRA